MIIEQEKKLKNNLYLVLALVLISIFSYLFLLKTVTDKKNGELSEAISKLQEMELVQKNFSANDKLLRETKLEREKLDSLMINKKTLAKLIEEIEMLAGHSNVEITKTLSVEKNVQRPTENILKIGIRAKGTLRNVSYFSVLIENLPYKIKVKRLSLATSGSNISSVSTGVVAVNTTKGKAIPKEEMWVGDINFELLSYINE